MKIEWTKEILENIVKESSSKKEVLTKLNIRCAGGNFNTLKKYLELYSIDISHFIKNYRNMVYRNQTNKTPLDDILVKNSKFSRSQLKIRLYNDGLLEKKCCLCGQGEEWNGMKISLILDHINGVYNDNRIDNLQIVCPNCNAGLDTFAGRNSKIIKKEYFCECGKNIKSVSKKCNSCEKKKRRIVERPSYEILLKEVEDLGYSGTGRKYGVSDNSIRKWIKNYRLIA